MDLRDLTKEQLSTLECVLRDYLSMSALGLLDLLKEEKRRRLLPQLNGAEIIKQYLFKYVRFELCDGIGSYEIWKVKRIDVDDDKKQYTIYPEAPIVSNVDGTYSIDAYLEDVIIETDNDLKRLTIISKEEYDKEYQNALDYYKNLKKD